MNKRRRLIIIYVLSFITVGFMLITVFVMLLPPTFIDIKFSHEIQEHENPLLDRLMYSISYFGFWPQSAIMIAVISLLLLILKYKKAAGYVVLTSLSGLVSTVVKAMVGRPRPSENLVRIVLKTTQQSFPSGHVLFYVVFFGFLMILADQIEDVPAWLRRLVNVVCLFLILTIPLSRIYLGAHWFTDVTAGFLLGLLCLYLLAWLYLRKPAAANESPAAETE